MRLVLGEREVMTLVGEERRQEPRALLLRDEIANRVANLQLLGAQMKAVHLASPIAGVPPARTLHRRSWRAGATRCVTRGLDPRVHLLRKIFCEGWIAGSGPAMTAVGSEPSTTDLTPP